MGKGVGRPQTVPLGELRSIGDALYYTEPYSVGRQRSLCRVCKQYAETRSGTPEECKFTVRRYTPEDALREGGDGLKIVRVALDYKYNPRESPLFARRVHQGCRAGDVRDRWDRITDAFTLLGARHADEAFNMLSAQDPDLAPYSSRIRSWYIGQGQATAEDEPIIGRMEQAATNAETVLG